MITSMRVLRGSFSAGSLAAGLMIAGLWTVSPAGAAAQEPAAAPTDPLNFITPEDLENAMSLVRPQVRVERGEDNFILTLPSGITANAKLQNCDDAATFRNCRTVSVIINLFAPEGRSREELLEIVNDLNKRDIHGRSFLNDQDQIIARFGFVATGSETPRQLAYKITSWEAAVKSAVQSLYVDD